MSRSTLLDELQMLGLTRSECRAYLAIVKSGLCTAVQVSRESHLQRTEIYQLVSGLVSKGLVEETIDRPKRYRAIDPEITLPNLVKQTARRIEDIRNTTEELTAELGTMQNVLTSRKPHVRVIKGMDRITGNLLEMVASAEQEVWMIAARNLLITPRRIVERASKLISEKRLKARLVVELDEEVYNHLAKRGRLWEVRHANDIPVHLYGVDTSAIAVGLTPSRLGVSEVCVTHKEGVKALRSFFEAFWNQSMPMSVWAPTREQDRGTLPRRSVILGREQLYASVADWHTKARKRILECTPTENGPLRVVTHLGPGYLEAHNRGVAIRTLCQITRENVEIVKRLSEFSDVRHTEASTGVGIAVLDESEAALTYVQDDTPSVKCVTDVSVHTTDPKTICRLAELFNILWKSSTRADIKIRELSQEDA